MGRYGRQWPAPRWKSHSKLWPTIATQASGISNGFLAPYLSLRINKCMEGQNRKKKRENEDTDKTGHRRNVLKIIVRYEKLLIQQ